MTPALVVTSFTEVRNTEREERLVEVRGPGRCAPPAPACAAPPSPGGLPPSASADASRACATTPRRSVDPVGERHQSC